MREGDMRHKHSKVTVIIPTYNRANEIGRAIMSVMNQSYPHWKLLVIDDGSTDDTEAKMREWSRKDERISYYRMPGNKGVCHALNQALKLVDTEFMVQVDSDDWLEPSALEVLIKEMDLAPETTALAYGNHVQWTGSSRSPVMRRRSYRSDQRYDLIAWTSSMYPRFYRTSSLREVGGWETSDKYGGRYMEDRRIMFKLIERYDFRWIDRHLYNLTREQHTGRLTLQENKHKYNEIQKEMITRYLKKWGDHYYPWFYLSSGWLQVQLIPRNKFSSSPPPPQKPSSLRHSPTAIHWTGSGMGHSNPTPGNCRILRNNG
ncbi:glycosyltransferase family A protein [Ammoniphilus sp. YIM 78166]|uniref:glycosyltransferase family 2 protein n=1 Tax=Ammoniphilus sp. YIM 78166 TaxID=1644106 RepID=UPI00106FDCFA|nr:glycosyltransferase family A protein [Ammoniphilus sp. YIM 78166]